MPDDLDLATGEAPRDPEELEATAEGSSMLGPSTRMGAVHLTVSDLGRSIEYYTEAVGLTRLGSRGRPCLVRRGAEKSYSCWSRSRERDQLRWLYRAVSLRVARARAAPAREVAGARCARRVPLVGLSDHFVSEALYLADPDGHGIEIYWDRPRELWEGLVDIE